MISDNRSAAVSAVSNLLIYLLRRSTAQ